MIRTLKILAPILALSMATLCAHAADRETSDAIYNQAIVNEGTIDKALASLQAVADDSAKPAQQRADAQLTRGHLLWRDGQWQPALDAVEQAIKIRPSVDAYVLKAQLLDAAGDLAQ